MGVEVKFDMQAIARLTRAAFEAAELTMEDLRTDLNNSATMPRASGDMQDNQTFVAKTDNGASLVTGSPQARRLYYHPEYNFQQGHNHNAGGKWLEPYINGDKKDFVQDKFAEYYAEKAGLK